MVTGDAIINGGVGAFFHGDAKDCYDNLHVRLKAVPDEALRVCGVSPADVKAIHDAGLLTVSGSTWHIDGFRRKQVTSAVLETKRQQARDNRKRSGNDPERKRNASGNDPE